MAGSFQPLLLMLTRAGARVWGAVGGTGRKAISLLQFRAMSRVSVTAHWHGCIKQHMKPVGTHSINVKGKDYIPPMRRRASSIDVRTPLNCGVCCKARSGVITWARKLSLFKPHRGSRIREGPS